MSDESTSTQETGTASVESYRPTPYEDSTWTVVGEFLNQDYFEPMQFRTLSTDGLRVDPMFSNYGGLEGSAADGVRAHAPSGAQYAPTRKRPNAKADESELEQLKAEHEQALAQAVASARAEALEEGRQAAEAEYNEKFQILENRYAEVLRDIGTQLNESLEGIEHQAVNLAVSISEKLVGTIVDINPEYILAVVREALNLAGNAKIRSVRVSPQDLEFFNILSLSKEFKEYDGTWKFEADDTIKAGCIVETSAGQVDYDITKAWQRVAEHVAKVR